MRKNKGKDLRKPNIKASRSCQNNGGCPWCEGNRLHSTEKRKPIEETNDQEDGE